MLLLLIKTLLLPRIETDDLQGQVQTSPLMPNLNSNFNSPPVSSTLFCSSSRSSKIPSSFFYLLQSELQFYFISEFENQ